MPPGSLSTLAVMNPGPSTERSARIRYLRMDRFAVRRTSARGMSCLPRKDSGYKLGLPVVNCRAQVSAPRAVRLEWSQPLDAGPIRPFQAERAPVRRTVSRRDDSAQQHVFLLLRLGPNVGKRVAERNHLFAK